MNRVSIITGIIIFLTTTSGANQPNLDSALDGLAKYVKSFTTNVDGLTTFEYETITSRQPMSDEEAEKWLILAIQYNDIQEGKIPNVEKSKNSRGFQESKQTYIDGYIYKSSSIFTISPGLFDVRIFNDDGKQRFKLKECNGKIEILNDEQNEGELIVLNSESDHKRIYDYFLLDWYSDIFLKNIELSYKVNDVGNIEIRGHDIGIDTIYVLEITQNEDYFVPIKCTIKSNKLFWTRFITYNNYVKRSGLLLPSYVQKNFTPREDRLGSGCALGPFESMFILID